MPSQVLQARGEEEEIGGTAGREKQVTQDGKEGERMVSVEEQGCQKPQERSKWRGASGGGEGFPDEDMDCWA